MMKLPYYLLLCLLYPIALLPFSLLYLLSDLTYFLVFHVIKYRRKVVQANLKCSFPEKTTAELNLIEKQFYKQFCDHWLEMIKLLTIRKSTLLKRFTGNWEVLEQGLKNNGKVYTLLGHQFNWEWGSVATQWNISGQFAGIYLPQNSKIVDQIVLKLRGRSKARLVPANGLFPYLKRLQNTPHVVGFMADQTPGSLKIANWYNFLNQDTPFFNGPEKFARKNNAQVVFAQIVRIERGYYKINFQLYSTQSDEVKEGAITNAYVQFLSDSLKQYPANWLWTHRRWKHSFPGNIPIHNIQ